MKKIVRNILGFICVCAAFSSCEKYTAPEPDFTEYDFKPNITIAELRAKHEISNPSLPPKKVTEDWIIKGVIVADDESGNIYKSLYIQDETAGINLAIDQVNMYNIMPVGRIVYVKLKGLYYGDYRGAYQIGYKDGTQMGRWDWTWEDVRDENGNYPYKHYYPSGKPSKDNLPAPKEISSANDLNIDVTSTLVTLKNVTFTDGGKETWAVKEENTNRDVVFEDGTKIIVRTSGYSNFYADTIPAGKGDITGIMSIYGSTYQLLIRDRNDIGTFTEE